jgi:hypothetical protein
VAQLIQRLFRKGDPLLELLFKKYQLNLLSLPREKIAIGDIYMYDGNRDRRTAPFGNISSFLTSDFQIPRPTSEIVADVSGANSKETIIDTGLKFLEGFLNILVAGVFGTDIKATLESENVQKLKFQFSETTREYVEPNDFGYKLDGYTVNDKSALFDPKSRYFLVTSVFRSPSIGIDAERINKKVFDVATKIIQLADISSKVSHSKSEEGMIVFRGKTKLGYAIQLFELEYDSDAKRVRMKPTKEYYRVLKEGEEQERTRQVLKPAFIGNEEEQDMLFEIE